MEDRERNKGARLLVDLERVDVGFFPAGNCNDDTADESYLASSASSVFVVGTCEVPATPAPVTTTTTPKSTTPGEAGCRERYRTQCERISVGATFATVGNKFTIL